jgi:hypothetical protein
VGAIWKFLLGINEAETTFARRGFRGGENGVRERMERVGTSFVAGYHAALDDDRPEVLATRLDDVAQDWRGFACEGAAMALALKDLLTPWRRDRVARFLASSGDAHTYMVHVAIGWAVARLPGRIEPRLASLDPVLRWLVLDGYGFHEGFFHWRKYLPDAPAPARVHGYAARAFDQGLGRSLWFVEGTDPARIAGTIAGFAEQRRPDLWSGIGLASVYAGELDQAGLRQLRDLAGPHHPQLAQGAAFAAKARHRAGNPTPYTDRACWTLCGMSSADAASVTDATLENLPAGTDAEPAFEIWRRRIQQRLANGKELSR